MRMVATVPGMSSDEAGRDLAALVVASTGALVETGDLWEPYLLVDQIGETVVAVSAFLRELQATGRAAVTQRSYGMDLTAAPDEVIAGVLAHHRRQEAAGAASPDRVPRPAPGYRPETMETLFGRRPQ